MPKNAWGVIFTLVGSLWFFGCSSGGQQDLDSEEQPDLAMPRDGGVDGSTADMALPLPPAEGKGLWGLSYDADFMAVAIDAKSGALYVAGRFTRADFGDGVVTASGVVDDVVLKFDRAGKREWARTFGRPYWDTLGGIAVAPDGGVAIVGSSTSDDHTDSHDVLVVRYGADGKQLGFRVYASPKIDSGNGIGVAADGSLYFGGGTEGDINFGGGPLGAPKNRDPYLVHTNADGVHLWSKRFIGMSFGHIAALAVAPDGDVLITGHATADVDFGDKPTQPPGETHAFLARYAPAGELRWVKRLGPCSARCGSTGTALRMAPNGDVVFGGDYGGPINLGAGEVGKATGIFAARYDATGRYLSGRVWQPLADGGFLFTLDVDRDDQLILGGQFDGDWDLGGGPSPRSAGTALVAKLTWDGRQRWLRRLGGTNGNGLTALAVDSDNSIVAVGKYLDKATTIDAATLTGPGFILRLSR